MRIVFAIAFAVLLAAVPSVRGEGVRDIARLTAEARARGVVHRSAEALSDPNLSLTYFEVDGTVRDAFRDETNPEFVWLVLSEGSESFHATIDLAWCPDRDVERRLKALVGAEISVFGFYDPYIERKRPFKGPTLKFGSMDDIRVRRSAPDDPFAAEPVGNLSYSRPRDIQTLGRRRARGRVLAAWNGDTFLLQTDDAHASATRNRFMRIELAEPRLPAPGDGVTVVGLPETDLSHVNFSRAIWRPDPDVAPLAPSAPTNLTVRALLGDGRINPDFHGRTVRLRGTVGATFRDSARLLLADGDAALAVHLPPDVPPPAAGTVLEATGVAVLDIGNWRLNAAFPRMRGYFLVTRGADDLRVLRAPPWWTAGRLFAALCALGGLVVAVLLWNASLRLLAERRGRQLLRERLGKAEAALKVEERTRLAVELHDSISQALTGVSFQVNSANRIAEADPARLRHHLGLASKALASCRMELRNCLWDLRSRTLEDPDLNRAIRQTLEPHVGDAALSVRFNVPRSRLTDNTVHTLLRILRELAANAVRHGRASAVRIAGALEGEQLFFSVTDNGAGFDPAAAPGVRDGHFGLEGVRERAEALHGDVTVESAPGRGARIVVTLNTHGRRTA